MFKPTFINSLLLTAILIIAYGEPQTYTYKTVGTLNITLDVYVPDHSLYDKYPVFFCIHGGSYVAGAKTTAFSSLELSEMLSLGFAVVSIDYRLAPGALMNDIVQDVQDAYNWVRTELVKNVTINPNQIVVFGRSAGGGLAVISGYSLSPRPKAIIGFYSGCTNFTEPYVYNPETPVSQVVITEANLLRTPVIVEHFSSGKLDPRTVLFDLAMLSGKGGWLLVSEDPTEAPEDVLTKLRAYSAVDNVDQEYPPTYLAHGLNDTTVPYEQSVMLAKVLNATNITYVLDLVPDAKHDFDLKATNTSSALWQEHVLPAFEFAQNIVNRDFIVDFDIISI